ncbi:MAG TPA: HD domain-containing phosphohydrolase, partial [Geobacteraceae bacterium]
AILMLFNCSVQKIQHDECIFRGGNSCRYVISWEKTLSSSLKRLRNYFVIASLVLISLLIPFTTWASLLNTVAAVTGAALLLSIIVQGREKKELGESLDKLRDSTDQLLEQININYNNALLTNEIGQAISRQTDVDAILGSVVQVLENRLDYERGLILLANPENTSLVFRAGFGYTEELLRLLNKTTFHLDRPESKGIFIVSFREQKPFLVNNMDEVEGNLSLRSLAVAKKLGAQSFICCPIICDGQSVGILAVDNVTSRRPLVQSDMSLLMGIAPVIGISIHNASLIDAKVRQFSSLLQVMAATIDARDPLTAGHSEKVTEYALGICGELGMSKEYSDMIRVAALLHDYGKIGVPDSILKKNGKLTDLEYEVVKTHAYKTRDILEQVNFDGVYCQVPEIAGSHHEKIDGSGYPKGLKGKAIPLGAKILAVADFFEAVTAKRHYRDPMPVEEAIRLLREGSGTHFEKKIVDALISYYSKSTTDQHLHLLKSS